MRVVLFFFFFLVMRGVLVFFFFFQAEDGIRDYKVTGVQTCALPICDPARRRCSPGPHGGPCQGSPAAKQSARARPGPSRGHASAASPAVVPLPDETTTGSPARAIA